MLLPFWQNLWTRYILLPLILGHINLIAPVFSKTKSQIVIFSDKLKSSLNQKGAGAAPAEAQEAGQAKEPPAEVHGPAPRPPASATPRPPEGRRARPRSRSRSRRALSAARNRALFRPRRKPATRETESPAVPKGPFLPGPVRASCPFIAGSLDRLRSYIRLVSKR